ncbi:MAG: DUF4390 domain-containing protein [Ferrovum myxofaciens]|nr:DUF4390 domain-containing protein [Ferrovum myxofaciens]QKE41299.1 MAG: DUF4390 domain-containing protein [Ferrovum myxofaciens]
MMAFSMLFSRNFRRFLAFSSLLWVFLAHAEGIDIQNAEVQWIDSANVSLTTNFMINLTSALKEAVERGIPLTFSLDLSLIQPRWYWFNRQVLTWHQERRLSYNPLTRGYRYSIGGLYLNFSSLDEALQALETVKAVPVHSQMPLGKGEQYQAQLHIELDTSHLPKPFQLDALYSGDWTLTSPNREWMFAP